MVGIGEDRSDGVTDGAEGRTVASERSESYRHWRLRVAERMATWLRLVVLAFSVLVYLAFVEPADQNPRAAYALVAIGALYIGGMYILRRRNPDTPALSSPAVIGAYTFFITGAVYATGGASSPFYLIYFVGVISVAFRYTLLDTLAAAAVFVAAYASVLAYLGQIDTAVGTLVARAGYIGIAAVIGGMLAQETVRQARGREEMTDLVGQLDQEVRLKTQALEQLEFRTSLLASQNEAAIDGILIVGPDGNVLSRNRRFLEIWGLDEDTLEPGGSDEDALEQARHMVVDDDAFMGPITELLDDPEASHRDEIELVDGRVLERWSTPVLGRDGRLFGRGWYFRDVTERKTTERQLEGESARQAALIATQNEIARARLEPDVVMRIIAERAQEITGADGAVIELVDADELVYAAATGTAAGSTGLRLHIDRSYSGTAVREGRVLRTADALEEPRADHEAVRRVGLRAMVVVPLETEKGIVGVLKVLSSRVGAFSEADARALEVLAGFGAVAIRNARDHRSRQEALQARTDALEDLWRANQRVTGILESINDAFIALDDQWRYTYVNQRTLDLMDDEASLAALIGQRLWDQFPELLGTDVERHLRRAMDERTQVEYEEYDDELDRWFHVRVFPSQDGLSIFFQDITERKRAQKALRDHVLELERLNRELDAFTYTASHDLAEPLRTISAFTEITLDEHGADLPEGAREDLGRVLRASRRMQDLLQGLTELSRAGRAAHEHEKVALADLMGDVVEDLATTIEVLDAEVEVLTPKATVIVDPLQFKQVLSNLVSNGLRYNDSTPPTVQVWADEGDDGTVLHVKDNGVGIPEDEQERIFALFDRGATPRGDGAGAGLAIVRKIVDRHGGDVWLDSTPGDGSTFHVLVPDR